MNYLDEYDVNRALIKNNFGYNRLSTRKIGELYLILAMFGASPIENTMSSVNNALVHKVGFSHPYRKHELITALISAGFIHKVHRSKKTYLNLTSKGKTMSHYLLSLLSHDFQDTELRETLSSNKKSHLTKKK